jgi:hypothetical protein
MDLLKSVLGPVGYIVLSALFTFFLNRMLQDRKEDKRHREEMVRKIEQIEKDVDDLIAWRKYAGEKHHE